MDKSNLRRILLSTEAPAALLLLLGIAGWGIPQLIDRATTGHPLEVSKERRTEGNETALAITIRNLSSTKLYNDLEFHFELPPGEDVAFVNAQLLRSMSASTPMNPSEMWKGGVTFEIPSLQPRQGFVMVVNYIGKYRPQFYLLNSKQSVYLKKSSIATWIVLHEFYIVGTIVMLAIIMAIVWLYLVLRPVGKVDADEERRP